MRSNGVLLLFSVLLAGCASPPTSGKLVAKELSGSDPEAQLNFWSTLSDEHLASNDQAIRALLLYMDGKDDAPDYAARVATMKSRKLLPASFDEPGDAAARKGTLAVAIMKILHQKGGLTTRLFGDSARYSTRELMFLNIYPPSTPNQVISGNQLVGIIGQVEDFQRGSALTAPAGSTPEEAK